MEKILLKNTDHPNSASIEAATSRPEASSREAEITSPPRAARPRLANER